MACCGGGREGRVTVRVGAVCFGVKCSQEWAFNWGAWDDRGASCGDIPLWHCAPIRRL